MRRTRRTTATIPDTGLERLRRELGRLDPWSYRSGPAPATIKADIVVAGVTGVFVVSECTTPGVLSSGRWGPTVSGTPVTGIGSIRSAAKRVSATIDAAAVYVEAEPIIVLTGAVVGSPRTVRGVRLVGLDQVAAEIAGRPTRLERGRVERAAKVLDIALPEAPPTDE